MASAYSQETNALQADRLKALLEYWHTCVRFDAEKLALQCEFEAAQQRVEEARRRKEEAQREKGAAAQAKVLSRIFSIMRGSTRKCTPCGGPTLPPGCALAPLRKWSQPYGG